VREKNKQKRRARRRDCRIQRGKVMRKLRLRLLRKDLWRRQRGVNMNCKAMGKNCQKRKLGTKWEQNTAWRRQRKEDIRG